jgi:hypothetical protein
LVTFLLKITHVCKGCSFKVTGCCENRVKLSQRFCLSTVHIILHVVNKALLRRTTRYLYLIWFQRHNDYRHLSGDKREYCVYRLRSYDRCGKHVNVPVHAQLQGFLPMYMSVPTYVHVPISCNVSTWGCPCPCPCPCLYPGPCSL